MRTIILAAIGCVLFLGVIGILAQDTPPATKPKAGISLPSLGPQAVTYAKYGRINNGMSYEQVRGIIGQPGEEVSRSKIDGIPGVMDPIETVMYSWANRNGSNMDAMFQNNKLMNKAQFGLR